MSGGKPDQQSARIAAKSQADIGRELVGFSKQIWGEAAPQRKIASDFWTGMTKGGPELQKAVAPQVNMATQQFATARKAIKELPPGGLRDISMRNASIAEAGAKTGIYSGGVADAITRLANQGNLGTQTGLSGMGQGAGAFGGAGGTFANLAQLGAQSSAGWGQGIGSLIAMI